MNTEQIIKFLKEEIALAVHQEPESIDPDLNFLKIGISSISTLRIINKIKKKLQVDISLVAMFEYKTISEFAKYLSQCCDEKAAIETS